MAPPSHIAMAQTTKTLTKQFAKKETSQGRNLGCTKTEAIFASYCTIWKLLPRTVRSWETGSPSGQWAQERQSSRLSPVLGRGLSGKKPMDKTCLNHAHHKNIHLWFWVSTTGSNLDIDIIIGTIRSIILFYNRDNPNVSVWWINLFTKARL